MSFRDEVVICLVKDSCLLIVFLIAPIPFPFSAKVKRLYDIANVMSSLDLITKVSRQESSEWVEIIVCRRIVAWWIIRHRYYCWLCHLAFEQFFYVFSFILQVPSGFKWAGPPINLMSSSGAQCLRIECRIQVMPDTMKDWSDRHLSISCCYLFFAPPSIIDTWKKKWLQRYFSSQNQDLEFSKY